MFKTLDVNVEGLINMLRFYKQNEIDNDSIEEKKYWINMVTENLQRHPVGNEKYMNRLYNKINKKFLDEELIRTNPTSRKEQCNNFNAAW